MIKGIKINNDLWLTFIKNKLVFGFSKKNEDFHHTISFGNKSGIFDLHLTNQKTNKHFTVITISHEEVYRILPQLLNKIERSVLDLEKLETGLFDKEKSIFYKIIEYENLIEEISKLKRKKKINIDKDSNEFKILSEQLIRNHKTEKISYSEILEMENFTGIAELNTESLFIIKSQYLENNIYKLKNLDLDITSVLQKVLGKDIYEQIIDRINIGISEIEK
jgi:hypothetical protein